MTSLIFVNYKITINIPRHREILLKKNVFPIKNRTCIPVAHQGNRFFSQNMPLQIRPPKTIMIRQGSLTHFRYERLSLGHFEVYMWFTFYTLSPYFIYWDKNENLSLASCILLFCWYHNVWYLQKTTIKTKTKRWKEDEFILKDEMHYICFVHFVISLTLNWK